MLFPVLREDTPLRVFKASPKDLSVKSLIIPFFRDCSMLHKTLVRKCGHRASSLILEFVSVNSCLNMLQHTPLVRVLAQALYVLIVHARMFNHIFTDHVHALFCRRSSGMLRDVSALLLRHPCLDVWAENVFRSGEWRTRPMVVRR